MTTAIEFQAKVDKAAVNMDRLDLLVNGSPTTDVPIDGGLSVPSFAKLQTAASVEVAGAAASASEAQAAASAVESYVNLWQVAYSGPVIETTSKVRYPRFIIERGGVVYQDVNPADYGLPYFEMDKGSNANAYFHYLDTTMIVPAQTAASPVKQLGAATTMAESLTVVPLAIAYYDTVTYFNRPQVITGNSRQIPQAAFQFAETIYDRFGLVYGTPDTLYFPLGRVYDPVVFGDMGNVSNAECTERKGYCKVSKGADPSVLQAFVMDGVTGLISAVDYAALSGFLGADPTRRLVLATVWNGQYSSPLHIRDADEYVRPNMLLGGASLDGPSIVPYPDGGTSFQSVVAPELLARGFTRGWKGAVNGRAVVGARFPRTIKKGEPVFIRYYVETDTVGGLNNLNLFLWSDATAGSGPLPTALSVALEQVVSTKAGMYSLFFVNPCDGIDYYYVGGTAGNGATITVTGLQHAFGKPAALDVYRDDYPAYNPPVPEESNFAARDAANLQRSAAMKNRLITYVQTPTAQYNFMLLEGQSLGAGQESWPSISTTNYGHNKMIGDAPFGAAYGDNNYAIFGALQFNDLVAKTVDSNHTTLLSDSQVAALQPGDGAFGEPASISWVNSAKFYLNQHLLTDNDASRTFVTANTAVSGQAISTFLPGGSWYGRAQAAITKAKTAAGASSIVATGVLWMQGEWDYLQQGGGVNRKSTYKASLNTLMDNYQTNLSAVTGQTRTIAKFLYQTGAGFTVDLDADGNPGLAIGMAQLETALERSDLWMIGPTYYTTDKGGHLDSNGYRWYGNKAGQVYHRVVHLGQDWEPLRPIRIEQIGQSIYLDFHVPEPPLQFGQPYNVNQAVGVADQGFKVTDANGKCAISEVTIIGQTQVRIDLVTATTGEVNVWYGVAENLGMGTLCDSDTTVAFDEYKYLPNSGMYASANIPALVDKPYPMQNFSVAFYYPVGLGL